MIGPKIRSDVRSRAKNACEYCHLHQDDSPLASLHVEHIIPKIHGGADDLDNLALACIHCNLHKGPNLTGIDPETKKITSLFHPRRQEWDDHFEWRGIQLIGKTARGLGFKSPRAYQFPQLTLNTHFNVHTNFLVSVADLP